MKRNAKRLLALLLVLTLCVGLFPGVAFAEGEEITGEPAPVGVGVLDDPNDGSEGDGGPSEPPAPAEEPEDPAPTEAGEDEPLQPAEPAAPPEGEPEDVPDALPADAEPNAVTASGTCGNNLTWTLDENGTLTISGTGDMENYTGNSAPWQGKGPIRAIVIDPGVTSIGDYAFYYCESLTSALISEGVTRIGAWAFFWCSSLAKVTIPKGVTSIGDHAFAGCNSLSNVSLPESMTRIGHYAFEFCKSLTSITIPNSTTSIGYSAFYYCSGLKSVTISEGITSILTSSFAFCESLTSVTIPSTVTNIGDRAFTGCSTLTEIRFTGSAPAIGEDAFVGVTATAYYLINDPSWTESVRQQYGGVITWKAIVASGECGDNLTWTLDEDGTLTISGTGDMWEWSSSRKVPWYSYRDTISTILLPDGMTSIGYNAFFECKNVIEIAIPESVTSIGTDAFFCCSGLTHVVIPAGVTSIGNELFCGCSELASVTIPDGIKVVPRYTFADCSSLSNIVIPDSVTNIGYGAFSGCKSLTSVQITSVKSIESCAFENCSSLSCVTIPSSVTDIGLDAFSSCISLTKITFVGNAPTINARCFPGVSATVFYPGNNETWTEAVRQQYGGVITWKAIVASGECGDNLTWTLDEDGTLTISGTGDMWDSPSWLNYRDQITAVELPDGLTSLGRSAFYECKNLNSIDLPTGIISIGESAFTGCSNLSSISIPFGVISIGNDAFQDCSNLESVLIPESVCRIGESAFHSCSKLISVSIPYGVTSIEVATFENCTDLTSVIIPNSVTSIESSVFGNCSSLVDVTLPDSVTSIGPYVFSGCSSLKSFTIPSGVEKIEKCTFQKCSNLSRIILPDSLSSIDDFAFDQCSSLESVTIPSYVVSIGWLSFRFCSNLTQIYFEGNAPTIDPAAFLKDTALVYYPNDGTWTEDKRKDYGGTLTWILNGGTVFFDPNGGEVSVDSIAVTNGRPHGELPVPKRIGYSFDGWYTAIQGGELVTAETIVETFCDYTLYARWTANNYSISFNPNGGSVAPASKTVTYDTFYGELPIPTRAGYSFLGWFTAEEDGELVTEETIVATAHDHTLYADWIANKYIVYFDANGGTGAPEEQTKTHDIDLILSMKQPSRADESAGSYAVTLDAQGGSIETSSLTAPRIRSYSFSEWNTEADGSGTSYNPGDNYTRNASVTLFAQWGSSVTTDAVILPSPEREGYDFLGWANDPSADSPIFSGGESLVPNDDLTLFALWSIKTYSVRYDANGGTGAPEEQTKTWGEPLTLSEVTPTRDCFVFLGWAEGPDAPVAHYQPDSVYEGNAELSLYALWGETRILSEPLLLDCEYLILAEGENVQLTLPTLTSAWAPFVAWNVEPSEAGSADPVRVENGLVTAVAPGTAYVKATLTYRGLVLTARCRVDVVADKEGVDSPIADDVKWNGVRLTSSKATVELFKTDYARVEIIPVLSRNISAQSNVIPQSPEIPEGVGAIRSARFASDAANELFALRVADDRTLEIIPRDSALLLGESKPASIKGSYKTTILVNIDGTELETGALTLTVKKSKPAVTVKAVKLNSAFRGDEQPLVFAKGEVTAIEPVGTAPSWLRVDAENLRLGYDGSANGKNSAKLKLLVTIDGWALRKELTVSVSSAPTAPTISPKAATLTLLPAAGNEVSTTVKVSPAVYTDAERFPITVSRIEEAKVGSFENGTVLDAEIADGVLTVRPGPALDSSKAHTFKLYLSVNGKEKAVTVKTTALKAPTLTLKAAGFVDSALPGSSITLTATAKSYFGLCEPVLRVQKTKAATKTSPAVDEDVTGLFVLTPAPGQGKAAVTLRAADPAAIEKGYTYTAYLSLRLPDGSQTAESKVKLNLKWSDPAKLKASATVKAAGFIDVLRAGSEAKLTPTVKNCYDWAMTPGDLTVTRTYNGSAKQKVSEDWTDRFAVRVENGAWYISIREGAAVSHADKFTVSAVVRSPSAGELAAKAVTVTVKQGTVKISQSVKAVTLLRDDRFSRGVVTLTPTDSALRIARVELDSASLTRFELTELENGAFAIGLAGNRLNTAKTATVKLRVFLEGNLTATPNATISVKVSFQ